MPFLFVVLIMIKFAIVAYFVKFSSGLPKFVTDEKQSKNFLITISAF